MNVRQIDEIYPPDPNNPHQVEEMVAESLNTLQELFTFPLEGNPRTDSKIIHSLTEEMLEVARLKNVRNPNIRLPHIVLASIFVIRTMLDEAYEQAAKRGAGRVQ